MGIKGLPKLIETIAGTYAIKTYEFSRFADMKISIDASPMIYQTVISMRSSGKDMKNKKGGLTSHLHGIFYKVLTFLQNNMVPIFVFDGKSPDMKNKTLQKRNDRRLDAETHLKNLTDSEDEEYIKYFKQVFRPTKQDIEECQIMLDLMGIPWITAPGEADVVCAWLAIRHDERGKRYVKGVCSDDSDMLVLGAPYLFKNMLKFMNGKKTIKVISLRKTLVKMNLTMDQFVDLCILMGCDYCENIKGIGPNTAYKLLHKNDNLENVLKHISKRTNQSKSKKNLEKKIHMM